MPKTAAILWELLDPAERRAAARTVPLVVLAALVDAAAVGAIAPVLVALGGTPRSGAPLPLESLAFAGVALVAGAAILRVVARARLLGWLRSAHVGLTGRIAESVLRRPYERLARRDTSELMRVLVRDVDTAVAQTGQALAQGVAALVLLVALGVVLALHDARTGLGAVAGLGLAYGVMVLALRRRIAAGGRARQEASEERFAAAREILGDPKSLRVLGREAPYVARLRDATKRFADARVEVELLTATPRAGLELLLAGALAVALVAGTGFAGAEALPSLGLYAFAAYRAVPAAQRVFAAAAWARFGLPVLEELEAQAKEPAAPPPRTAEAGEGPIALAAVRYRYPGAARDALAGVDVELAPDEWVGLVGRSGAGKTTLLDVLAGLLPPSEGTRSVAGTPGAAVRRVGYVAPAPFLAEDTLAANIAFGVPAVDRDAQSIARACDAAALEEVIASLPQGLATRIGQGGWRPSQGEAQRIGIARALTTEPELLCLDEATSGLDAATENQLLDALRSRGGRVVIATHRPSVMRRCDRLVWLEEGRIRATGAPDALLRALEADAALAAPPRRAGNGE